MVSKLSEDYTCPLCPKKLSLINTKDSAIHHCHICGLIIDVMCRSCNALEQKRPTFRNRFLFGFSIRARAGKYPWIAKLEIAIDVLTPKFRDFQLEG